MSFEDPRIIFILILIVGAIIITLILALKEIILSKHKTETKSTETNFCPQCGTPTEKDSAYCKKCGKELK